MVKCGLCSAFVFLLCELHANTNESTNTSHGPLPGLLLQAGSAEKPAGKEKKEKKAEEDDDGLDDLFSD